MTFVKHLFIHAQKTILQPLRGVVAEETQAAQNRMREDMEADIRPGGAHGQLGVQAGDHNRRHSAQRANSMSASFPHQALVWPRRLASGIGRRRAGMRKAAGA